MRSLLSVKKTSFFYLILCLEGSRVSELLFQIPTRFVDIGRSWRGKPEILENAYKYRRYVTYVTRLDPLSLGELGGGVQFFGEFGASGRAKTMKIGRLAGSCTN